MEKILPLHICSIYKQFSKFKPLSEGLESYKTWFHVLIYHRMNKTFSIRALKKYFQSMLFIVVQYCLLSAGKCCSIMYDALLVLLHVVKGC